MGGRTASLALWASVVLSGCTTVQQRDVWWSFAPPLIAQDTSSPRQSVPAEISLALVRQKNFTDASDQLANAPLAFDLPAMVAGLTGLGGAVFKARPDITAGAGFAATTLLVPRAYFKFDTRQSAYLAASQAEACVAEAGEPLSGIDGANWDRWNRAYDWSASDPSDLAKHVNRIAPLALGAARSMHGAIEAIEGQLRKKLATPTQPDISGFAAQYKANLVQLQQSAAENKQAVAFAALTPRRGSAEYLALAVAVRPTDEAEDAADLMSHQVLLNALSSLSTDLAACKALLS